MDGLVWAQFAVKNSFQDSTILGSSNAQHGALYELCLRESADGGKALITQLAREAQEVAKALAGNDRAKREKLGMSMRLLNGLLPEFSARFPGVLRRAFDAPEQVGSTTQMGAIRFDQLQLMDEAQVEENMEMARLQALIKGEVEETLEQLTAYISTLQGFKSIRPDRNPLRPEIYLDSLQKLFTKIDVGADVRHDWLRCMGTVLGKALKQEYDRWLQVFRSAGIPPATYARLPDGEENIAEKALAAATERSGDLGNALTDAPKFAPTGPGGAWPSAPAGAWAAGPGGGAWAPAPAYGVPAQGVGLYTPGRPREDVQLTVQQLHRLVMGDFEQRRHGDRGDQTRIPVTGDRRGSAGFEGTVPAALEALEEMQKVDEAMARLQRRGGAPSPHLRGRRATDNLPPQAAFTPAAELAYMQPQQLYGQLREESITVGQILGLEVVTLMIESIVNDERLLQPVRDVVAQLESPLLRLVMVDPRFFNDKTHPARRLLQEITDRSAAFEVADAPSFMAFLQPLRQAVDELEHVPIEGPEPFELTLNLLVPIWEESREREREHHALAVRTLLHVEQRNIEAGRISLQIQARPDAVFVPPAVVDFASGPWAQVVAQALVLAKAAQAEAPAAVANLEKQAREALDLVPELFWSVRPDLAGQDKDRLVRLIPLLLNRLRAGLKTIDYPAGDTAEFFDQLMGFHQRSLQTNAPTVARSNWGELGAGADAQSRSNQPRAGATPVWMAPGEAQASGFSSLGVEFPELKQNEPPAVAYNARLRDSTQMPLTNDRAPTVRDIPENAWDNAHPAPGSGMIPMELDRSLNADTLRVGEWYNLLRSGSTTRAQFVWASPEKTMYMFTTSTGRNQSMPRETVDGLIRSGSIQVLMPPKVIDQALDAVAQVAVRNSLQEANAGRKPRS